MSAAAPAPAAVAAAVAPVRLVKARAVRVAPPSGPRTAPPVAVDPVELEARLAEAHGRGLAEGREAARAEAAVVAAGAAAQAAGALAAAAGAVARGERGDAAEAARLVAEGALEVAGWVLGRELTADDLGPRLAAALDVLVPAPGLQVRVAREAVDATRALVAGADLDVAAEVVADDALAAGEAVLRCRAGSADVTVAAALAAARHALGLDHAGVPAADGGAG